jgi:hypothetical protein
MKNLRDPLNRILFLLERMLKMALDSNDIPSSVKVILLGEVFTLLMVAEIAVIFWLLRLD